MPRGAQLLAHLLEWPLGEVTASHRRRAAFRKTLKNVKCNYHQTEDLQPHQKHLVVAVLVWLAWVSLSGEEGRKTPGSSMFNVF